MAIGTHATGEQAAGLTSRIVGATLNPKQLLCQPTAVTAANRMRTVHPTLSTIHLTSFVSIGASQRRLATLGQPRLVGRLRSFASK